MKDNTLRNQSDIGASRTPKAEPLGNVSGELIETLADIEHERWSSWMNWLYENGTWNTDQEFTINTEKAIRWKQLASMSYAQLDDEVKEYDRIEVRKTLSAIKNRLPKEPEVERGAEHWDWGNYDDSYNYGQEIGYVDCLKEVKQALDIESALDNVSGLPKYHPDRGLYECPKCHAFYAYALPCYKCGYDCLASVGKKVTEALPNNNGSGNPEVPMPSPKSGEGKEK